MKARLGSAGGDCSTSAPSGAGMTEEGFRRLIEILPEALVVVGSEGELRFANAAARCLLGGPGVALPETLPGFPRQAGTATVCLREDEDEPLVCTANVAEAEWEDEPAWVAALHQITGSERTRREIEAFLSHSQVVIYARDRRGRYTLANGPFARAAGRTVDEVLGKTAAALFLVEAAECFDDSHRRILDSGESRSFEVVTARPGGEQVHLCKEFPLRDDEGRIYAVAGIATDITASKRTEETLRGVEARWRAILESSLDCVVIMDASERVLEFNRAAERTFSYQRGEVMGRRMADLLIAPAQRESFRARLRCSLQAGGDRVFDSRVEVIALRQGGAEFPIEAAVSVARHGDEPVFITVLHDITQRSQAHQELIRQTEYLERVRARERQVLASIPSIFVGVDDSGVVTHWNPAAENQLGLPAEQVLGKPWRDLAIGWPAARIDEAITRCNGRSEAVRLDELPVADSHGRERILALTINRIAPGDDEGCGVVVVGGDITERKAMEAQLLLAQKMESIGQLAAGIAHEINTPTQYVSDNTRFLRDSFNDLKQILDRYALLRAAARQGPVPASMLDQLEQLAASADLDFLTEEIPKAIEQSLDGLNRVAEIVRAMKQFSHPDQDAPELANLNAAISNTVTVARNEWKYVADMELDLDEALPTVPCLVGPFNQVILNLIINSAHAIAGTNAGGSEAKGRIRITTRQHGDCVEIRVADTGGGIPQKIRNRIFDPFFTTKQVGKGTGQGLAIAHNIVVEKHGGTIEVESEDGKGATFILRLPLQAAEQPVENRA